MERIGTMTESRLLTFTGNLANYAGYHAERMAVPEDVLYNYRSTQESFAERMSTVSNPQTRTTAAIKLKDQAKKALVTATSTFIKMYLQYNPQVNEEDLANMELSSRIPKPRSKHPVPTTKPLLELKLNEHYQVTIDYRDETSERSKRKPAGVHGIEIRWEYAAAVTTTPPNPDRFTHTEVDTATPYVLHLNPDDQGKHLYIVARWENTTGEKGPWGETMSTIVP